MIDYLLVALIIAAVIQSNSSGRAAACTFAGLTVALDFIQLPAEVYYLAHAANDGIIALMLSRIAIKNNMAFDLQNLCLLSIVINIAGWLARQQQIPPAAYDSVFLFFYSATIVSLLMRRIGDAHSPANTNNPWIPLHFYRCYFINREHEGKT